MIRVGDTSCNPPYKADSRLTRRHWHASREGLCRWLENCVIGTGNLTGEGQSVFDQDGDIGTGRLFQCTAYWSLPDPSRRVGPAPADDR